MVSSVSEKACAGSSHLRTTNAFHIEVRVFPVKRPHDGGSVCVSGRLTGGDEQTDHTRTPRSERATNSTNRCTSGMVPCSRLNTLTASDAVRSEFNSSL